MKNVLLWDPRFPKRDPWRLVTTDTLAAAITADGNGVVVGTIAVVVAPVPGLTLPVIAGQVLVASAGQSLGEYPYLRGTPTVATFFAQALRTAFGFSAANPVNNYNTKTLYHDATGGAGGTNWTVRLEDYASGGSALLDVNAPQAGYALTTGNYWWNTVNNTATTGNVLDTVDSPGPLARAMAAGLIAGVAAGRSYHMIDWSQGEADGPANSDTTMAALYKATLVKLIAYLRLAAGNPTLPFGIYMLGRHQVATNVEAIRDIQRQVISEGTNVFRLAEQYPHRYATTGASSADAATSTTSNVVTMSDTSKFSANNGVEGPGIPEGAFVSAVNNNVSITLQRMVNGVANVCYPTANATGVTLRALDNVHLYPGSTAQPLDTAGSTTHDTSQGFYAVRAIAARRIAHIYGKGGFTSSEGPYVSVCAAQKGQPVVTVTVTHDTGTDLTVHDNTGWRVTGDGAALTVSSVARVNATTIALTLSANITADQITVQYGYGSMNKADRSQFIFDDAGFPMRTRSVVSAATTAAAPTVTISSAISQNEGNSGTTAYTYTVTRSASAGAAAIPWTFAAGTTDATDFVGGLPAGGTLNLADGVASGTITINVQGDTTVESNETFTVSITPPAGYAAGTATSATGTIVNDDVGSYDTAAQAIFTAMTTAPSTATKGAINALVTGLKTYTDGGVAAAIWPLIDKLMVANQDSQSTLLDWKNPGATTFSVTGAPTFTAFAGFKGLNTTTDYLDLGYNPSTTSLGIAKDNAHAMVYVPANGTTTSAIMSDGQRLTMRARRGTFGYIKLNSSTTTATTGSTTDAPLCLIATRTGDGNQNGFVDGVLNPNPSVAVASVNPPGAITMLKSSDQTAFAASVGQYLTANQAAELTRLVKVYGQTVGTLP